jgi:hypothetical protein
MTEWHPTRHALHAQMYPPEEKAARRREAQARYRKAHAKRFDMARTVQHPDASTLALRRHADTGPGDHRPARQIRACPSQIAVRAT